MVTMTASQARQDLFPLLSRINADCDEVRITSRGGNGVLISETEWESWQTTRYLFSSPANADWLIESIRQADSGDLITPDPAIFDNDDDR